MRFDDSMKKAYLIITLVLFLLISHGQLLLSQGNKYVLLTNKAGLSQRLDYFEFGWVTEGDIEAWSNELELMTNQCVSMTLPFTNIEKVEYVTVSYNPCRKRNNRYLKVTSGTQIYNGWENHYYIGVRSVDRMGKEIRIDLKNIKEIEIFRD